MQQKEERERKSQNKAHARRNEIGKEKRNKNKKLTLKIPYRKLKDF